MLDIEGQGSVVEPVVQEERTDVQVQSDDSSGPGGEALGDGLYCADDIDLCQDGSAGDACDATADCDGADYICDDDTSLCRHRAEGEPCANEDACPEGLYCADDVSECRDGSTGDECDATVDCDEADDLCDDGTGLCRDRVETEACTDDPECPTGLYCASAAGECRDGSTGDECDATADCDEIEDICKGDTPTCQDRISGDACSEHAGCPAAAPTCSPADVCTCLYFVDADSAIDTPDGLSWASAFPSVQESLDTAAATVTAGATSCEIWVAEGTYLPSKQTDDADPRSATFELVSHVELYGGFTGTELAHDERDFETYVTTLSGDIGVTDDASDNAYHVVIGSDDAVLDGFTITAGMADNIEGAASVRYGGGMFNSEVSPHVANCKFIGNTAVKGGGMYIANSSPTISSCAFVENRATHAVWESLGSGGGISMRNGGSPTIENTLFIGNSARFSGGGIDSGSGHGTISNCIFLENTAGEWGGGLHTNDSTVQIVSSTFWRNSAREGGGVRTGKGGATVSNCTIAGNHCAPDTGCSNVSDISMSCHVATCDGLLWYDTVMCAADGSCPDAVLTEDCDDGNACTDDTCGAEAGCGHDYNSYVEACYTGLGGTAGVGECHTGTHTCAAGVFGDCLDELTPETEVCNDIDDDCDDHTDEGFGQAGDDCVCVRYVDIDSAAGTPDGLEWPTAFPNVQDGIDSARSAVEAESGPESCDVWVAEGTYFVYETDRSDTIQLEPGLHLYGGFAGDETAREQRDWETRLTTLDGHDVTEIHRVYHVVTGSDGAVLDGFTVTGGLADGESTLEKRGAGMYNVSSSPTVANCTFSGNEASHHGGGMYNSYSSPAVSGCAFVGNVASSHGGGMYNHQSAPAITACEFEGNAAGYGGGLATYGAEADPEVEASRFIGNSANYGGALYAGADSAPLLTSCVLRGNTAVRGGAVRTEAGSSAHLLHCTVTANEATARGGAVYSYESDTLVTNSILWGNSAPSGAELYDYSSTPIVTYSDVAGGYDGDGNIDADPLFEDVDAGDVRLLPISPCIDAADGSAAPERDIEGNPRVDDAVAENTGQGPPWADMGAYELFTCDIGSARFFDDFDDGDLAGWTVVDETGGSGDPPSWSVVDGSVHQTANTYLDDPPKHSGTFLWTGDPTWADYAVAATLMSTDDDGIGLVFRYDPDTGDYYRFHLRNAPNGAFLTKRVGGVSTWLWSSDAAETYEIGVPFTLQIAVRGGTIEVYVDGELYLDYTDDSEPLVAGAVGLFAWGNNGARFDHVVVTDGACDAGTLVCSSDGESLLCENIVCLLSDDSPTIDLGRGAGGPFVLACDIRVVAASRWDGLATGAAFTLVYDDSLLTLDGMYHLRCYPGFGCFYLSVLEVALPRGHTVISSPEQPSEWAGSGSVQIVHFTAQDTPLTGAFFESDGTTINGDPMLFTATFLLDAPIDPAAPSPVVLTALQFADEVPQVLDTVVNSDGIIVTSSP